MWMMLLTCFWGGVRDQAVEPDGAPLVLVLEMAPEFDRSSEVWFDVAYLAQPNGETLFREPGERLWWLQERAILVLGSTGLPLPADVSARASVWVHLIADDGREFGPFELSPRRDGVTLGADISSLAAKLGQRLAGIDSAYLAQVAHFLVGNLAALNVIGTSYEVSGFGSVINSSGDWVGGKLASVSGVSSVFVGQYAGSSDDGSDNKKVAVGYLALSADTSSDSSTAVGFQAMQNATGGNNVAVGRSALRSASGNYNSALGAYAMFNTTTGQENVAIGDMALFLNQTGSKNTALGFESLKNQVSASGNTAVGYQALTSNIGPSNTAVGNTALFKNTSGNRNTAVGEGAGFWNNSGSSNTALGYWALYGSDGSDNVGIGRSAVSSADGNSNVGVGNYALSNSASGSYNTALGESALEYCLAGSNNTAVGWKSLVNFTGSNATAMGFEALSAATTGSSNTALGYQAMKALTTGASNTAVGDGALAANVNGANNTALGTQALAANQDHQNTAIGDQALKSYTGNRTTALGNESGTLSGNVAVSWTGQWNTFLGRYTQTSANGITNSTAIGDAVSVSASNQVRIGDGGVTSIGGTVGWTTLSDGRFKRNVREDVPGLDFIRQLRPVTYELDRSAAGKFLGASDKGKSAGPSTQESGFIAQEVEAAMKKSAFPFSGIDIPANEQTPYGLRYGQFVVPLVKAVQEQDAEIAALKAEIAELKRLLQNR